MAVIGELQVNIALNVTDDTIQAVCGLLNVWQDAHPGKIVLLAPDGDKYSYQVCDVPEGQISRKRRRE